MVKQLNIPKEFWQELEEVYRAELLAADEEIEEEDGELVIPRGFWKELEAVYEEEFKAGAFDVKEPEDDIFPQLQKALDEIVKEAAQTVEKARENSDSPLFLPFSLFEPMDRERDEVHYTKTLAWFMEKKNPHDFKDGVLKALLPIFPLEGDGFDSDNCHVEAEFWDEELKNRLDIAIMKGDRIIVAIEAKIDAEEGRRFSRKGEKVLTQLRAYDKWLDEKHPDSKNNRIFLVPDEDRDIGSEEWRKVSWRKVAKVLLEFLRTADQASTGYHYLRFFVASIIRDIDGVSPNNVVATASYLNAL